MILRTGPTMNVDNTEMDGTFTVNVVRALIRFYRQNTVFYLPQQINRVLYNIDVSTNCSFQVQTLKTNIYFSSRYTITNKKRACEQKTKKKKKKIVPILLDFGTYVYNH